MSEQTFGQVRRQSYIDEVAYLNTLENIRMSISISEQKCRQEGREPDAQSFTLSFIANQQWFEFQLRYTAGDALDTLAARLTSVVEAHERFVESLDLVPSDKYFPPFRLDDLIDTYVDYVNLLAACVLFHREDLIPRVAAFNRGTDFDGVDAIIEELLKFYLDERPFADELYWEKPYGDLLDVIDSETPAARGERMGQYVKSWYRSMKGRAAFWGSHEKVKLEFSPYCGYWSFCAAAFTYLYDIDDGFYRNEIVYPKDLVDYARSIPRRPVKLTDGREMLRVAGGQACQREGIWFTPAKADSARRFRVGDIMPVFDFADYGMTIWQLNE